MAQNEDQFRNASTVGGDERGNLQGQEKSQAETPANKTASQKRFERGTDMDFFEMSSQNDHPDAEPANKDVATNDGSVVETLDTAFHDVPGFNGGENLSGSNRADYYEARSQSKSDTEEELEARRREGERNDE